MRPNFFYFNLINNIHFLPLPTSTAYLQFNPTSTLQKFFAYPVLKIKPYSNWSTYIRRRKKGVYFATDKCFCIGFTNLLLLSLIFGFFKMDRSTKSVLQNKNLCKMCFKISRKDFCLLLFDRLYFVVVLLPL